MSFYSKFMGVKQYVPIWVKDMGKELLLELRRRNGNRMSPDFIIIGVQKGGTTSLFTYLMEHPQVLAPLHKQTFYFDRYYNKPIEYYKAAFPSLQSQERIRSTIGKKVCTGEATPDYFYEPSVPDRIKLSRINPKFIVIFRDPYERCISSFNYFPEYFENYDSIDDYFTDEIKAYNLYFSFENSYQDLYKHFGAFPIISRSLYDIQLDNWLSHYPIDQFLFVRSSSLKNQKEQVLDRICSFLEIDSYVSSLEKSYNITKRKKQYLSSHIEGELKGILTKHYNRFLNTING